MRRDIGLMMQPGNSLYRWAGGYPGGAIDNGCFAGGWTEGYWLRWLRDFAPRNSLFAVVPDVLADPVATNARWTHYAAKVRRLGFPLAYVAQDGVRARDIPWSEVDVLFIGGTTDWKESPAVEGLLLDAQWRGKRTHMGRVNTYRRLQLARDWGCESADGTLLGFGCKKNLPILVRFLDRLDEESPRHDQSGGSLYQRGGGCA